MTFVNYDVAWTQWGDMIKYSPAPFHRRRLILEMTRVLPYRSALDVGCGNGAMLRALAQQNKAERLVGVDISAHVVEVNRQNLPFEFETLDVAASALAEKFDLVVCSEVVEHVANYQDALAHLHAMCSGWLILTVPSGKIYPIDRAMGHAQHFVAANLEQTLTRHGFIVEQLWQWGFPFHTFYKYVINLSPEASMNRFSRGTYTNNDKLFARVLTQLFYLNLKRWGTQLVICARAK